jgi:hypothetical protein
MRKRLSAFMAWLFEALFWLWETILLAPGWAEQKVLVHYVAGLRWRPFFIAYSCVLMVTGCVWGLSYALQEGKHHILFLMSLVSFAIGAPILVAGCKLHANGERQEGQLRGKILLSGLVMTAGGFFVVLFFAALVAALCFAVGRL